MERCKTSVDHVFGCAQRLFGDEIVHEDRQNIETETAALREDLELLTDRVSRRVVDLETLLTQWTQYGRVNSGLLDWIEENQTSPDVDNWATDANDTLEIAQRLAKQWFRKQADELERREQQARQLEELVGKLTAADETTAESDTMRKQLAHVRTALTSKRERIKVRSDWPDIGSRRYLTRARGSFWSRSTDISGNMVASCRLAVFVEPQKITDPVSN